MTAQRSLLEATQARAARCESEGRTCAQQLVSVMKREGAPEVLEVEPVLKLTGSPRNRYGTHASAHGFKGDYEQAWRLHFSKVGGGSLGVAAAGPLRGTVRRVSMIAAGMKPPCNLPSGENVAARGGPPSPLSGSYPEHPKDYGLTEWAKPSEDGLTQEDLRFSCSDLAVIKRCALAEIRRRAADRAKQEAEQAKVVAKRTAVPDVLHFGAPIPDHGSGLPESLEKVVPDELRYWEAEGDARTEKRDQLIRSALFTPDTLRIVGDELRATTIKRFLYEKGDPLPARPTTAAGQLASIIPKGRDYRHPFLTDDWRTAIADAADVAEALLVVSPPTSAYCPQEVVAALDDVTRADWLVEWDDTPAARAAFKDLGYGAFKLPGDDRLFCASFQVTMRGVEWVDKVAPVAKPFPGEHAARQTDPEQYDSFRRGHPEGFPDGIDVIWGIKDGKTEIQSLRAKTEQWTVARFRQWLQDHNFKTTVEEAGEKLLKRDIPIVKAAEERFVYGIVLEPNDGRNGAPLDPDAHADIYSAEDIRNAAHHFMEFHRNLGLMHREFITGAARILESYVAPVDFESNGTKVRKGTWLLAVRIVDDELWRRVKVGEFTGFSIGGSAIRRPVTDGRSN